VPSQDAVLPEVRRLLDSGARIPGLGHNLHSKVDPRVEVLTRIAEVEGLRGAHIHALNDVRDVAARETGQALIVNAAGAIGAILSDMGYPVSKVRGFALVARAAGLVAHVVDEQAHPMAREVWVRAHDRQARR
jgi:citrate synthase